MTKKRFISFLLCFVLIIGMIPMNVFAANNQVVATTQDVVWENGTWEVNTAQDNELLVNKRIEVKGNVTLILTSGQLKAASGIHVGKGNKLTIKGTNGKLFSTTYYVEGNAGAAIGGNVGEDAGTIIIESGYVKAIGANFNAGIGGGAFYQKPNINMPDKYTIESAGSGGNIEIKGGTVVATGYEGGAGIGGGCGIDDKGIDGQQSAKGGSGGNITISGNANVTAHSSTLGAAIGGGYNGNSGNITIEGNPTVTANGIGKSTAIGAGYNGNVETINILGGNVSANTGIDNLNVQVTNQSGNAIGLCIQKADAVNNEGGTINIKNANLKINDNTDASGSAIDNNNGTINIENSNVIAKTGSYALGEKNNATIKAETINVNNSNITTSCTVGGKLTAKGSYVEAGNILDKSYISNLDGMIVDNGDIAVGGKYEIQNDLTVNGGNILTVLPNSTLTLPQNKTITNNGIIKNDGTVQNNGAIKNNGVFKGNAVLGNAIVDNEKIIDATHNDGVWSEGVWTVKGEVTLSKRAEVTGNVTLVLTEGSILKAPDGIHVGTQTNGLPNSLTIEGTGTLYADAYSSTTEITEEMKLRAAIGGNTNHVGDSWDKTAPLEGCGAIVINGGNIIVNKSAHLSGSRYSYPIGAGIGGAGLFVGSRNDVDIKGTVTINGGNVESYAWNGSAIGGAQSLYIEKVTINGGIVKTFVHKNGSCIGPGYDTSEKIKDKVMNIEINGGDIYSSCENSESFSAAIGIPGNAKSTPTINLTLGDNSPSIHILQNHIGISVTNRTNKTGIVTEDNGTTYTVYGNTTLKKDLTIPAGGKLVLADGASLTLAQGVTLTNNGTVDMSLGNGINNWTPNGTVVEPLTTYLVKHMVQDLNNPDSYTLKENEVKRASIDQTETMAEAKTYDGFTAGVVTQKPVSADGSTVVEIKYTRNKYKLTWNLLDGAASNTYTSGEVMYGTPIVAPILAKNNYSFEGWDSEVVATMPNSDLTYTAQWKVIPTIGFNNNSFNYDGNKHIPTVTLYNGIDASAPVIPANEYSVKYEVMDESGAYVEVAEPTFAGNYKVVITDNAGGSYDFPNLITELSKEFIINKVVAKANAPIKEILTYNGTSQNLFSQIPSSADGTVYYSFEENGTYTTTPPTGLEAKQYDIWWYVKGDLNHLDSEKFNITSEIKNNWTPVKDTEYTISATDWTKDNVTVSAKDGYLLSTQNLAGTADDWVSQLVVDTEGVTNDTFYVKNVSTGEISLGVDVTAKVDKTAPTGAITIGQTKWQSFVNTITFGLFYKDTQNVKIEANDALSGVKSVEYYKSATPMTLDEVKANSTWTTYTDAFNVIAVDNEQFVIYAKVTDNVGNVFYLSTNGNEFDQSVPVITGITDGGTYYTTQKVTVTDDNLASVKIINLDTLEYTDCGFINNTCELTLTGDFNLNTKIEAKDKAGNIVAYTVTRKTLDTFNKTITVDDVKSSDKASITADKTELEALRALPNNSRDENTKIDELIAEDQALLDKIAKIDTILASPSIVAVKDKTVTDVKSTDKANLTDAKTKLEDVLTNNADNLTDAEKADAQAKFDNVTAMLDVLTQIDTKLTDESIKATDNVKPENVKLDDKQNLTDAKKIIEDVLTNNADNLTADEKTELEAKLDNINKSIAVIEPVENVNNEINDISTDIMADDVKTVDAIRKAKTDYDALNDYQKSLVEKKDLKKLNDALDAIDYKVVDVSNDAKFTKAVDKELVITVNAAAEKFLTLFIDGKEIDKANYTVESGSTIITVKADYLNTLDAGEHSFTVKYSDDECDGKFTVNPAPVVETDEKSPATGNDYAIIFGAVLMLGLSLSVMTFTSRKKRTNK